MSETTVIKKDSYYRDVLKKFTAHKLAMIGVAIIVLEVLLVIFLPMILKLDPYTGVQRQTRPRAFPWDR